MYVCVRERERERVHIFIYRIYFCMCSRHCAPSMSIVESRRSSKYTVGCIRTRAHAPYGLKREGYAVYM
jgi:hypothetical protein